MKKVLRTPDKNKYGYLLECDIEYPSRIHGKNHFPFLPDKKDK